MDASVVRGWLQRWLGCFPEPSSRNGKRTTYGLDGRECARGGEHNSGFQWKDKSGQRASVRLCLLAGTVWLGMIA